MAAPSAQDTVDNAIASDDVVVFMKGSREAPHCGFSAQMVEILNHLLPNYSTYDVREDTLLRQAVKDYSGWPTFPQLYVRGEFVGGSDVVKELFVSGELATRLGVLPSALPNPELFVSRPALNALRRVAGTEAIRLDLDAQDEAHLAVSQKQATDIEIEIEGVRIILDVLTASRAEGLHIDYVDDPGGFVVRRAVSQPISTRELRALLTSDPGTILVDCRTLAEFQSGSLPEARHLDQELLAVLGTADPTPTVFICRNGSRSRNVAEHYAGLGVAPGRYLDGGIEAWDADDASATSKRDDHAL